MGTKIRVDQTSLENPDAWDEELETDKSNRKRKGQDRRREIEDHMEEIRLRREIGDSYSDYDDYD